MQFQPTLRRSYLHVAARTVVLMTAFDSMSASDKEFTTEDADNDHILRLGSSGRALVLSSRGVEEVEMSADVAREFFQSYVQVSKEKLCALQVLTPERIFDKGSAGEPLS